MAVFRFIIFIMIAVLLSACGRDAGSAKGFSLPIGDIENGAVIFDDLQCAACHTLHGHNNKVLQRVVNVRLGGPEKSYSYEYLLTSIINPSHKLAEGYETSRVSNNGESKMRRYNDFITVTELVDLVEYLRSALKVPRPPKTRYPELVLPKIRNPDGQENY